jgi:hypothetical protein
MPVDKDAIRRQAKAVAGSSEPSAADRKRRATLMDRQTRLDGLWNEVYWLATDPSNLSDAEFDAFVSDLERAVRRAL